jgi:hypothetical protein
MNIYMHAVVVHGRRLGRAIGARREREEAAARRAAVAVHRAGPRAGIEASTRGARGPRRQRQPEMTEMDSSAELHEPAPKWSLLPAVDTGAAKSVQCTIAKPTPKWKRGMRLEENKSVYGGLSAMYWTATDYSDGSEPAHSLLARVVQLSTALFLAAGCYNTYRFAVGRIAELTALAPLAMSLLQIFVVRAVSTVVHPDTGHLIRMSGCRALPEASLIRLKCCRYCFVILSLLDLISGLTISAVWLATGMDPAGVYSIGAMVGNHNVNNILATVCNQMFALMFTFAVYPFLYTFIAACLLAYHAADTAVLSIEEADKIDEPLTVAVTHQLGRMIQMLQEEVLDPLTLGWGTASGLFIVAMMAVVATCVPEGLQGSGAALSMGVWCVVAGMLVLFPLALVNHRATDTLSALNDCRTIGKQSNKGIIDLELNVASQISVLEDYLKALNKGEGPGTVVFEVRVTTKLLKAAAIFVWTWGTVATSKLVELQAHKTGPSECGLSSVQIATIKAAMLENNHTCVYNMTVSDVIRMH